MNDEHLTAIERLLARSQIPREAQKRVLNVVSDTSLTLDDKYDVAEELIAHFDDGLSAGKSVEELLEAFGDGRITAGLITKTRRKIKTRTSENTYHSHERPASL